MRRYALALTHQHAFTPALMLRTTVYAYQIDRAWRRQEYDRTGALTDYERACDPMGRCGAPGAAGVNPTTRRREPVLPAHRGDPRPRPSACSASSPGSPGTGHAGDSVEGELTAPSCASTPRTPTTSASSRTYPTGSAGTSIDAEVRNGYALAAAVQNRFGFGERFYVTPGVRFEGFWSDRRMTRAPAGRRDGPDHHPRRRHLRQLVDRGAHPGPRALVQGQRPAHALHGRAPRLRAAPHPRRRLPRGRQPPARPRALLEHRARLPRPLRPLAQRRGRGLPHRVREPDHPAQRGGRRRGRERVQHRPQPAPGRRVERDLRPRPPARSAPRRPSRSRSR